VLFLRRAWKVAIKVLFAFGSRDRDRTLGFEIACGEEFKVVIHLGCQAAAFVSRFAPGLRSRPEGEPRLYVLAILGVVLAWAARTALNPWLGHEQPFVTLYPVIALMAWLADDGLVG